MSELNCDDINDKNVASNTTVEQLDSNVNTNNSKQLDKEVEEKLDKEEKKADITVEEKVDKEVEKKVNNETEKKVDNEVEEKVNKAEEKVDNEAAEKVEEKVVDNEAVEKVELLKSMFPSFAHPVLLAILQFSHDSVEEAANMIIDRMPENVIQTLSEWSSQYNEQCSALHNNFATSRRNRATTTTNINNAAFDKEQNENVYQLVSSIVQEFSDSDNEGDMLEQHDVINTNSSGDYSPEMRDYNNNNSSNNNNNSEQQEEFLDSIFTHGEKCLDASIEQSDNNQSNILNIDITTLIREALGINEESKEEVISEGDITHDTTITTDVDLAAQEAADAEFALQLQLADMEKQKKYEKQKQEEMNTLSDSLGDSYSDSYSYSSHNSMHYWDKQSLPYDPLRESWKDAASLSVPKKYNVPSLNQITIRAKRSGGFVSKVITKLDTGKWSAYSVVQTYKVLKPGNLKRFEAKRLEFRKKYGKWSSKSSACLAFHGTKADRIPGIMKKGLVVPSKSGVSNATDSGWYGAGIYLSPEISTALRYGDGCVLVCSVLLGKLYRCKKKMHGGALIPGYDSHREPIFNEFLGREYIIFDADQVLPVYLLLMKKTPNY